MNVSSFVFFQFANLSRVLWLRLLYCANNKKVQWYFCSNLQSTMCLFNALFFDNSWIHVLSSSIPKSKAFLSKIQNRISEKTGKKILLLHGIWIIWIKKFEVVVFPSNFWIQNIKVVVFPSNFWIQNFKVVVFPSIFWNTTMIWQFFRVILNFAQECYYLKNKVGVVDFTKARGVVKFQSPRALWALGL